MPTQPTPLWGPGTMIDRRYRVESRLGAGGMGEVYQAYDTTLERRVALKRIFHDTLSPEEMKQRALAEARLASQFSTPCIAHIHDVVLWENEFILVLELVSGATLREAIVGSLDLPRFYDVALQISGGVAVAHERGMVHGDLKPDNIMVDGEGQIKILDFGVARRLTGVHSMTVSLETRTAGTPAYTAPEVHRGNSPSKRSDVYALGVIFYELLCGARPFRGDTLALQIEQILNHEPSPISRHRVDVPGALQRLVQAMLAKDPRVRPALEVVQDSLESLAKSGSDPTPLRPLPLPPRPRKIKAKAMVVILLVLVTMAVVLRLVPFSGGPKLPLNPLVAVLPLVVPYQDPHDAAFAVGCAALLTDLLGREYSDEMQTAHFRKVILSRGSSLDLRSQWGVTALIKTAFHKEGGKAQVQMQLARTDSVGTLKTFQGDVPLDATDFLGSLDRALHSLLNRPMTSRWYEGEGSATLRLYVLGLGNAWMAQESGLEPAERERFFSQSLDDFRLSWGTTAAFARGHAASARALLAWGPSGTPAMARERVEEALREAEIAVSQDSLLADAHQALGAALLKRGEQEAAEHAFRKALELDPHFYEPVDALWRLLYRANRLDEALALMEEQRALHPQDSRNYVNMGYILMKQGDYSGALQATKEAIDREPENYLPYSNAGGIALSMGRYAEARALLEAATRKYPDGRSLTNLGTAAYYTRHFEEAARCYNDAIERLESLGRGPDYRLWRNLGDALHQISAPSARSAYDQSLQILVQEIAASGADPFLESRHALLLSRLGRDAEARLALAAIPGDVAPEVLATAALAWLELGQLERAMQILERAVSLGFSVHELRDSAEFDPFRRHPRFQRLLSSGE